MEATTAATVRPGDSILNWKNGHWVVSTVLNVHRDGEWITLHVEGIRYIELRYDRAVRVNRKAVA